MEFAQSAEELPTRYHDEAQELLTHGFGDTVIYMLDTIDYIQVYVEYLVVLLANDHGAALLEINSGFKNAR